MRPTPTARVPPPAASRCVDTFHHADSIHYQVSHTQLRRLNVAGHGHQTRNRLSPEEARTLSITTLANRDDDTTSLHMFAVSPLTQTFCSSGGLHGTHKKTQDKAAKSQTRSRLHPRQVGNSRHSSVRGTRRFVRPVSVRRSHATTVSAQKVACYMVPDNRSRRRPSSDMYRLSSDAHSRVRHSQKTDRRHQDKKPVFAERVPCL